MSEKDVIDAIKKMRPTVYNYKARPETDKIQFDDKEHFGFIAQELEELFPKDTYGVVTEDPFGNLQVRYHEIIPMLVRYIHHLEERVNKLEEDVEEK